MVNLLKKHIFNCKKTFYRTIFNKGIVHQYEGSKVYIASDSFSKNSVISVGNNASLIIQQGVKITGEIKIGSNSSLIIKANTIIEGIQIVIGDNSNVVIGENCSFNSFYNGRLSIGVNCVINISNDCHFENIRWLIENATISIGKNCTYICPENHLGSIVMYSGNLTIGEYVFIQASIATRFNGIVSIGDFAGIGYNTEIRSEESVSIGKYALISYNVSIFDTNTHTIDWEERRRLKHKYHPQRMGMADESKPDTKPIIIGDDVWLGKGVSISKGAVLKDRCIVGMSTVVPSGQYPADAVVVSSKPRIL